MYTMFKVLLQKLQTSIRAHVTCYNVQSKLSIQHQVLDEINNHQLTNYYHNHNVLLILQQLFLSTIIPFLKMQKYKK